MGSKKDLGLEKKLQELSLKVTNLEQNLNLFQSHQLSQIITLQTTQSEQQESIIEKLEELRGEIRQEGLQLKEMMKERFRE